MYEWRIGCPRAVAHLTKDTSADSSAGRQGLVSNVNFASRLASMQMTKQRCTRRSSCIENLIVVLIGPIRKPSNGFGNVLSDLGASRPFRLGHGDGEN